MYLKIKNIYFFILSVIILSMVALLDAKAQTPSNDKESAKVFVQKFYDWYVPLYDADVPGAKNRVTPQKMAVTKKADNFDVNLLKALVDYYRPVPKGAGDIMGIDMDPFLSAQDSGARYMAGDVKQTGDKFFVDIHRAENGRSKSEVLKGELPVVVELININGHWKFVDFIYENKVDLLQLIASYNKEVKETLAKKH